MASRYLLAIKKPTPHFYGVGPVLPPRLKHVTHTQRKFVRDNMRFHLLIF